MVWCEDTKSSCIVEEGANGQKADFFVDEFVVTTD